jgi:hypothetical protein
VCVKFCKLVFWSRSGHEVNRVGAELRAALVKLLKDQFGIAPSSDENEVAQQTIEATSISYAVPALESPHRSVLAAAPFTIPQIGLQGTATVYYPVNTRKIMGCLSIYMGVGVGDPNALKLLTSA